MKNNIIFLGPLGWKKNIWSNVTHDLDNKFDFTYFEFPNTNITNLENYMDQCNNTINKLQNGIIIACSYGVWVLSYLINNLKLNIQGIIIIDGLAPPPTSNDIDAIDKNRIYKYTNLSTYLEDVLDEDELNNPFLKKIVTSNFCCEKNEHFMNNNTLIEYVSYFSKKSNIISQLIYNIKSSNYNFYIFSNKNYKFLNTYPNVIFKSISDSDHLLMLTKPHKITNCINSLIKSV